MRGLIAEEIKWLSYERLLTYEIIQCVVFVFDKIVHYHLYRTFCVSDNQI